MHWRSWKIAQQFVESNQLSSSESSSSQNLRESPNTQIMMNCLFWLRYCCLHDFESPHIDYFQSIASAAWPSVTYWLSKEFAKWTVTYPTCKIAFSIGFDSECSNKKKMLSKPFWHFLSQIISRKSPSRFLMCFHSLELISHVIALFSTYHSSLFIRINAYHSES